MAHLFSKVAAVIPALNEEASIEKVLEAIKEVKEIDEIIVVDDGSTDQTAQKARQAGVRVISLGVNRGKGEAMQCGVKATRAEIIVFSDADLLNLQPSHLRTILTPVLSGQYQMTTGTLERGKHIDRLNHYLEAPFSGLRVVRRELWEAVPSHFKKGYLVESGLHWTAKRNNIETKNFVLSGLEHLTKIKKQGKTKGILAYLIMWAQIIIGFPYHVILWLGKRRGTKAA